MGAPDAVPLVSLNRGGSKRRQRMAFDDSEEGASSAHLKN